MKKTALLFLLTALVVNLAGQETKKITYKVDLDECKIEYKKVTDIDYFTTLKKKDLPVYIVDSVNLAQIQIATDMIEYLDLQRAKLKNNSEVTRALENEYQNVIKAQENRVMVYKNAYEQMKSINEDLSNQIDIAIEVGRKSAKRNKMNNVIYGVMGGIVTGITIGVIVSN